MQVIVAISTQATTQKKRSAPLDPKAADKLLDLLGTDNAFRRLFKKSPQAALAQIGFVESTVLASPAWCFSGITTLAPKADIIKTRAELKLMLTSGLTHISPTLDAARITRRTRK